LGDQLTLAFDGPQVEKHRWREEALFGVGGILDHNCGGDDDVFGVG
tara:strand:+ start:721 stop:858 length:138 start_codon:yes stop_codon:yes gene_type:complete